MKTIYLSLVALLTIIVFSSCEKNDEQLEDLKNEALTFDEFFNEVSSKQLKLGDENVLYINYEWNKKENLITLISSEEREPNAFLLKNMINSQKNKGKDKYKVSCSNGDNSWTKTCNGKFSCGKMVYGCLKSGGCAEICQMEMAYVPQNGTFYLYDGRGKPTIEEDPGTRE